VDADSSVAPAVGDRRPYGNASRPAGAEEFMRTYYRDLIANTMYFGADIEQAKEAVARALVDVVRDWKRIRDPLSWARTAAINHYLKEKTRGLERIRNRLVERGAGNPQGDDRSQLTIWEDEQWVMQKLGLLSPKQAEVMSLVLEGFAPTQIAELLGRNPDAVRQNLRKARKRLKKAMQQERAYDRKPGNGRSSSRKEG
jgi:RNA polymerase sigma factor (sigma-70 family)